MKKILKEKTYRHNGKNAGFTLIEILVVIGIIAVLALIVLVAINPARQFALSRNAQRQSNVEAVLSAIGQNMADNKGIFTCTVTGNATQTLPTLATSTIASCNGITCPAGKIDLSCLVPTYIAALPFDPSAPGAVWNSTSSYDTEYTVQQTNGRVTVDAPGAAAETVISNPAPVISVTR